MKKFFTLIAAVAMAASMNAQTVYSFENTTKDNYSFDATWYEWDSKTDGQINYLTGSKNEYAPLALKDTPVALSFKNSKAKSKAFTLFSGFMMAQGKGTRIEVSGLTAGQEIVFSVGSKGSTPSEFEVVSGCEKVGAIPEFSAKDGDAEPTFLDVKVKATDATAIIRETAGGFAIKSVTVSAAGGETTGISTIEAASAKQGKTYNVAGQEVSASYKGLVIKNGKKYVK